MRCKLLPLLLEWDARQGPVPPPASGVQLILTAIRKLSERGAKAGSKGSATPSAAPTAAAGVGDMIDRNGGMGAATCGGGVWPRYLVVVGRMEAGQGEQEERDYKIDKDWIEGEGLGGRSGNWQEWPPDKCGEHCDRLQRLCNVVPFSLARWWSCVK